MAAGDPRPLLVYLQDHESDKKVTGLLTAALASERFQLASRWFHCVRVDRQVLDPASPYHALFEGRQPPRLVLASRDGKQVVPFLASSRQKVSWQGITRVLKHDYRKDPTTAVKAIERLLNRFDALDNKRRELNGQLARASKANQRDRVASLQAGLAENEQARAALFAEQARYADLGLRSKADKSD